MSDWILAFDAGCRSCRDLADDVERLADGRVTVRNLRDAEVDAWRRAASDGDPPWAPTLLRVDGDDVRQWVGTALSLRLLDLLGPLRAWRVARAVSRSQALATAQEKAASRRRFLRAAPVAAGAFLLSGGRAFAQEEPTRYQLRPSERRTRGRLRSVAERNPDFRAIRRELQRQGMRPDPDEWTSRDLYEDGAFVRSAIGATFVDRHDEAVEVVLGEEADGRTWVVALGGSDDARYGLQVSDGRVVRTEASEVQQTQDTCQTVCEWICVVGCSCCSCGLACAIIGAGNVFAGIICAGICAVVCDARVGCRGCQDVC